MIYPVVIHKDKGSAYGVTVLDIPGCFSAGNTLEEALENTREAIFAHLELVAEEGGDIPEASEIDKYVGTEEVAEGILGFVDADIEDLLGPAERINVTIPKRALQKIDMAVKQSGDSRSALLTRAALGLIKSSGTISLVGSGGGYAVLKKSYGKNKVSEGSRSDQTNAIKPRAKASAAAKRKA